MEAEDMEADMDTAMDTATVTAVDFTDEILKI